MSTPDYQALAEQFVELQNERNVVHELLSRIVEQQRTITFDSGSPLPDGFLKWESVQTESGDKQTTIWFVPATEDGQEQK